MPHIEKTTEASTATSVGPTADAPDENDCRIYGEPLGEVTACKRPILVTIEPAHSPPVAHLYMRSPHYGWRWTSGLTLKNAKRLRWLLGQVIDRLEAEETKLRGAAADPPQPYFVRLRAPK